MSSGAAATAFAPSERLPEAEIRRQAALLEKLPQLPTLFDAVSAVVMIINKQRQIVYANEACIKMFGVEDVDCIRGQRPGEAMQCAHAHDLEGGCGTAEFCRTCGAVKAVLASQQGRREARECRITRKRDDEALDLLVWATPFPFDGEFFTIVAFADISHEKRRQALERIFFHDILNDAGALQGLTELLCNVAPEQAEEFRRDIYRISHNLVDEIESQRALTLAESGDLEPRLGIIHSRDILLELVGACRAHPVAEGRTIALDPESCDMPFVSDQTLLRRVLGNMIKNALEASEPGQTVTLSSGAVNGNVRFSVHNPTTMPREVQMQIFQRSFSTKGDGRGLGTYSIKLLTERYLNGKVSFTTTPDEGTTFVAQYPLTLEK